LSGCRVWKDVRLCLATLHQLNPLVVAAAAAAADGEATGAAGAGESKESSVQVLVLGHTRELAFQIAARVRTLQQYLPSIKTAVFTEVSISRPTRIFC
jgi:superfamily II DNA/RNA helicase